MRSSMSMKEVQQLTILIIVMSHFLSYEDDKAFLFFSPLRKKGKLECTSEREKDFSKVKEFHMLP